MIGGWEGWERWNRARDNDRRRAVTRNRRILGIAERWRGEIERAITAALGRYLQLGFPDAVTRPEVRVTVRTDVSDQHAGSLRTVTWVTAPNRPASARTADLPDLALVLVSWREPLGERIWFRFAGAEHLASGNVAQWLESRLEAWLVDALERHR